MSKSLDTLTSTTSPSPINKLVATHAYKDAETGATIIEDSEASFSQVKVPLSRSQFIAVYIGLLLAIMLAALDQTIVSTALRAIVTEFGKQELVPWIGSSFLLTAAPLGTLYGKFADIWGRKPVFIFAIVVFELGSLLCGAATSMEFLIVGRAIAGVGGGGIFALVLIILSDIVSIQDRGKYQGAIGAIFGLSSVIAPLLGGAFSDHVSWRWCFYINLPLGAITLATVAFLRFPAVEGTIREKIARIDGYGACLLFASIICLVTPLQLGGSIWEWASAQVIIMFILSIIFGAAFVYVELYIAKEPIIPPQIFINSSVPALLGVGLCLGAGFLSCAYYISLFFQVVFEESATAAGLELIPLVFGLVITSISSGVLTSKFGRYQPFFFVGPVVMIFGTVLVSGFDGNSSLVERVFFLIIFGLGVGCLMQMRVIAMQASVPHEMIAIATALIQTCNTLGGAIGVAITGSIFNNLIVSNTANASELQLVVQQLNSHGIPAQTSEVLQLLGIFETAGIYYPRNDTAAAAVYNATLVMAQRQLIDGFNGAFRTAYLSALPYPVIILLLAFFIKQYQMKAGGPGVANH
ncbi:UNVERIFIED_CONTAM: hypothetical protein HDU68_010156 [Siphonaria sp. JEL0065]|nr:hypothetical protein HDU68_010156 [Siphonaria sp. JEL0065]